MNWFDVAGNGLFQYTIVSLSWTECGNPRKISVQPSSETDRIRIKVRRVTVQQTYLK